VIREKKQCQTRRGALALAATLVCLLAALPAAALTANEAFTDGNRLFRDDLYWAALLRYHQAGEAGMNSPLLHYNTGVAHYRAQQHIRARTSLLKAAEAAGLRVISHYNLGLNAYASGDIDDALDWFRRARDQQENAKIRRLAITAISRLLAERRAADPVLVRENEKRKERPLFKLDLHVRIGYGSDDNVFRAPKQPYIDFSDPALPLVTPEEFSGAFVPVDLRARFSINSLKWESFFGQYRMSGRFHSDETLNNADEFSHEIRFGSEFDRREDNEKSRVYSAFTIAQHDETYLDPDDGIPRTIGLEDIDDRLNYVRYGPELSLQKGFERLSFGLRIKGQLWNYEDLELVPEYDHEYFVFGGNVQYKFTSTSLLRLTVDKSSRRYGDRPAFDLNGQQLITNPNLRYDHLELGLLARQRITRNMWFGFGYENAQRTDRFLGYNDYSRDTYKFEFHWSPGRRFDLELNAQYRIYDYPNAFAFHNPIAGLKTLESADGELVATYRITPHWSLVAEAEYRETVSTDARIAYDRNRYSIGVVWQQ
jgi:hypothetical protein